MTFISFFRQHGDTDILPQSLFVSPLLATLSASDPQTVLENFLFHPGRESAEKADLTLITGFLMYMRALEKRLLVCVER